MKLPVRSFIPAVIALIVSTILFCLPGNEFPEQDWYEMVFLDKWIHIGLFVTLVSLWSLPFIPRMQDTKALRKTFVRIAIAFALYGILIEFVQDNFIPNRTFGLDDMLADAIGCGLGVVFCNWQLKKQLS